MYFRKGHDALEQLLFCLLREQMLDIDSESYLSFP
jgi:hypothetical protein